MRCFCGRAVRGFFFIQQGFDKRHPPVGCCSMNCLGIAKDLEGDMQSINADEHKAVEDASEDIGAFLEDLGKTDLADMTQDEWLAFLSHAYKCVCSRVDEQYRGGAPF